MSEDIEDRNRKIVVELINQCLIRNQECPDYGGKGKKATDMALNFFVGAANLAKIQGDEELHDFLRRICIFDIAIRGIEGLEDMLKEIEELEELEKETTEQ